ncbi:retrovirus-related pol polyprotein from transposon TNT 1-94 [Tanacetum coccineum]|uniref:Retrovirus-related pol polyprotein from transposon TNT 1-94 n=1 Tax=Tanacetum coccineum TaxID=301880 RepID=A0ABQ5B485_9ASTR
MIDCLRIVKTDKVIHTVETDIVKLVVEIESFSMSSDEFDKETGSSDGLQPKQADLSCVHALNELDLHEIHVVPNAADNSGPIFDTEPLQKVQNDNDNYNVFANDKEHPEQPEFVNDTYLKEQGDTNITIDSLDMSTNGETVDQDYDDLAKKCDLLASLIDKLKCEIDDNKNHNKLLESSNKTLVDKLKGEIKDFKTKNKSLESSNNHFKEANNKLSKINQLMFKTLRSPKLNLIGCYNDNLALMLASESDEMIHLAHESRSKLKEMVADLRYFNSLEHEADSLKSQLATQKTQFLNEIDRLFREYYYADHINAILGVYTTLDEFTDLQCDYVDQVVKYERLEKELSKSNITSKSFEALQHAINLELALQQCQEQIKNDKAFKENQSKVFLKEREQYFEIQGLKAQLQDKGIEISELKKLIEKMKGKSVETKFEKPSVIQQPNAFKSQRQSVLGTVKFGNDQIVPILDLEVAFRKSTCYICDLKGIDLLTGLHDQVRTVQTDKGTKFLNKTLHTYFAQEGIEHQNLSPSHQSQENVPQAAETVTTSNELDLLFSLIFDKLLNGTTLVVSKYSVVTTADALNQHHPLEQVIGNPSQLIRTICQLETDGEMCMFALTVSQTEPKNIKESMADSAWIKAMQEELHQFD